MPTPPIPVVILAAGASRRLGMPKQLALYRGQTLLGHAVATALAAGSGSVVVVLGAGADPLGREVTGPGVRVVANPDWATGMASSVRSGVAAVEEAVPDAGAILFTVCDQPLVTADLLEAITREHRAGHDLVAASYGETVGVPALFSRRYLAELAALTGDEGARRVLARHADLVRAIPFPDAALDVDTPADLARLALA